jgi:hypothetical protein
MKHFLFLMLIAMNLLAGDATGKWTGTLTAPSDDGGEKTSGALLILKQDGDKLTGTAGPDDSERHSIENGKAENGTITFEVPRENGIMKFNLKQDGEEMKGEITRTRDGQMQTAKLVVKREK